jgi:hypothetical protein
MALVRGVFYYFGRGAGIVAFLVVMGLGLYLELLENLINDIRQRNALKE